MRPLVAAVIGGLAGAVAALAVSAAMSSPMETPAAPDDAVTRTLARLAARVERLEHASEQRSRATEPAGLAVSTASDPAPEEFSGPERRDAGTPALEQPQTHEDLSKVASADLALEADERHMRNTGLAGATRRYRELLSRGGTPEERRRWFIRLGDCFYRLDHVDEAMQAYRDCVEASIEDHPERVACMLSLARHAGSESPDEALRWVDRAFEMESGREDAEVHRYSLSIAQETQDADRELRELTWLLDRRPADSRAKGWSDRLAELRGDTR
jgi:hypothetical protein